MGSSKKHHGEKEAARTMGVRVSELLTGAPGATAAVA